jgi:predicted regulator of Ras-like GTPase activity (Roadblock/LC7/MglB family)
MTRADLLAQALDEFLAVSPEVEAAAIVTSDGLPMASALPEDVEEDRLAAMSAALLILGERAAAGLGKGELSEVMVESSEGYVVLMSAGATAVLVAIASTEARAGLLLYEMRAMADRVAVLMGPDVAGDGASTAAAEPAATQDTAPDGSAQPTGSSLPR